MTSFVRDSLLCVFICTSLPINKIQDSRFLFYQQYLTNGSTIMTKTDVHTNTNLTSMSAMT